MAFKVGITGGIGSGKSMICQLLEEKGFPIFYSDDESKKLVQTHPEIKKELIALLGQNVYVNNQLNKTFLAAQLFNDDHIREKVNQIIHPVVRKTFATWAENQTSPIVFNEAAILIETGTYKTLDFTVLVVAPKEVKIQRVMERDGVSEAEVEARMNKQWSDEQKIPLADFIIHNDGSALNHQLENLLEKINSLALHTK